MVSGRQQGRPGPLPSVNNRHSCGMETAVLHQVGRPVSLMEIWCPSGPSGFSLASPCQSHGCFQILSLISRNHIAERH